MAPSLTDRSFYHFACNDIMASGKLSAEGVLGTLFEDELSLDESEDEVSLDESGGKDREDVYGYLGKSILWLSCMITIARNK